jgi:hypothetical protein
VAIPGVESRLGLQLKPTRIKGSHYLLIPKDLAELMEINDQSILNLTIEDTDRGQRLVYSVTQAKGQAAQHGQDAASSHSRTISQ